MSFNDHGELDLGRGKDIDTGGRYWHALTRSSPRSSKNFSLDVELNWILSHLYYSPAAELA